ncbi:hypothetical protein Z950_436 [Sulfitobacter mediterraneus KCTC 32188]|jgi:hypothetical protein|nr:hypothetical protein Z950_436 [Sulfitobacter mediterraneus KCTC 32188]
MFDPSEVPGKRPERGIFGKGSPHPCVAKNLRQIAADHPPNGSNDGFVTILFGFP